MLQNNKSVKWGEVLFIFVVFTFSWKIVIYFVAPYTYCDDHFAFIRFSLVIVLLFIYKDVFFKINFQAKLFQVFILFVSYGMILYSFDIIIHFLINPALKYEYLTYKYTQWYSDNSVKDEVKRFGKLASIDDSVNGAVTRYYSISAFVKQFFIQIGIYFVLSIVLVKVFTKYEPE